MEVQPLTARPWRCRWVPTTTNRPHLLAVASFGGGLSLISVSYASPSLAATETYADAGVAVGGSVVASECSCVPSHAGNADHTGLAVVGGAADPHLITTALDGTITLTGVLGNGDSGKATTQPSLEQRHVWNQDAIFPGKRSSGAAMCVCCSEARPDLCAVGYEGGAIALLSVSSLKAALIPRRATGLPVDSVAFLGASLVASGSPCGVDVTDIRDPSAPAFRLGCDSLRGEVHSLACHPTDPRVLACGYSDGTVALWDAAYPLQPLLSVRSHNGIVWDMRFHSRSPRFLASCSEDPSSATLLWDIGSTSAAVTGSGSGSNGSGGMAEVGYSVVEMMPKRVPALDTVGSPSNSADIHPDNGMLAVVSDNGLLGLIPGLM